MGADITHHDFGKGKREAARQFARLLGLVEAQQKELEDDPRRLFDMAGEEISRLRLILRSAEDALRPTVMHYTPDCASAAPRNSIDIAHVPADELRRLRDCAAIVRKWGECS